MPRMPIKRRMPDGCGKFIISRESWLWQRETAPRRRRIYGRAGTRTLTSPSLTTPLSEDAIEGHAFSPRRIAEIVPGRVYALSGFEFTEYYFVVSDDGRELIGIDAEDPAVPPGPPTRPCGAYALICRS